MEDFQAGATWSFSGHIAFQGREDVIRETFFKTLSGSIPQAKDAALNILKKIEKIKKRRNSAGVVLLSDVSLSSPVANREYSLHEKYTSRISRARRG